MPDNFPPDATHEQKGMPRSFFVDPSKLKELERVDWPEIPPAGTQYIPLDVTQNDADNIARNSRTYGG